VEGLSIVICCHNGASRLPDTLEYLKAQEAPGIPWEVLLIDNASSDDTASAAQSCWNGGPAPLRIVSEPRLGTRYARERGFAEAKYSLIGFVDDDNWLAPNWVRVAHQIMSSDRHLGAVSGISTAACDGSLPTWFDQYQSYYAVLTEQEMHRTQIPPLRLPTAGLCIRKAAWEELVERGFQSLVPGRVGRNLAGGEDTELTIALRFCGWKLEIDPRLRLRHFMPQHRLEWSYLRRLARGNDASTVLLDGYTDHSLSLKPGLRSWMSDWWCYQLLRCIALLVGQPRAVFAALASSRESEDRVIEIERLFGRILGLVHFKGRYGASRRLVRQASWISINSAGMPLRTASDGAAGPF
jgi:glycosyltransferase involved in cell wall biosynthesis